MLWFLILPCILLSQSQATPQAQESEENEAVTAENITLAISPSGVIEKRTLLNISCFIRLKVCSLRPKGRVLSTVLYKTTDNVTDLHFNYSSKGCYANYTKVSASISDSGTYKCKFERDNKTTVGPSKDVVVLEAVSNPDLKSLSTTLEITRGQTVTLFCLSSTGSPPINYTLFRSRKIQANANKDEKAAPFLYNITISSSSELGEYKCKASNRIPDLSKYSKGLNFTFIEGNITNASLLCIVLVLLCLLLVIGIALAIPFLIIPWCKSRKSRSARSVPEVAETNTNSENYVTYTTIEHGKSNEAEYANVTFIGKRKDDKVIVTEDTTVKYSEIILRDRKEGLYELV